MWDRDSIEALYRAHGFAVLRRCRRLLRQEEDAHDVTQEVFMDALARPDGFRGDAQISTYLFAAATNLCLRRLRDCGRRDESWLEGMLATRETQETSPEDSVATRESARELLASTDDLTASIAVYHFVDGLPQGEIAKLVGLSRVSVNQRLQRFRREAAEDRAS